MAGTQYDKYILRQTGSKKSSGAIPAVLPMALADAKDWNGIQHRINWKHISQPTVLVKEAHTHDFDQFLLFLGNDAANASNFGAEAEILMGKEGEKQIINGATVICIPRGMVHGPLSVTKVIRPILFCNIYLSPDYVRKPVKR